MPLVELSLANSALALTGEILWFRNNLQVLFQILSIVATFKKPTPEMLKQVIDALLSRKRMEYLK